jgi:hypothetical protein
VEDSCMQAELSLGFDFEPWPPVYEAATLLLCQGSKYINCPIGSFRAMMSRHVERKDFLANERISMSHEWRFHKPFVDLEVFASASAWYYGSLYFQVDQESRCSFGPIMYNTC